MTLLHSSAVELAAGIRRGEYTSREVVDAHIDRIRAVNPVINAVVAERFDAARAQADQADREIRAGTSTDDRALLGVPFTVKESLAVAGMPNTAGVVARSEYRPDASATVVQRVIDAGAINLGVTNTSEGCMWIESTNRVYGRTNNPYQPGRTAGGSSGGEGAVIGAGGSPFGLATDTLGSIRVPAACSGVFGHRPSTGLLPLTGAWPPPHGVARMCSNGVLTRRASDLVPLLRIMAGPDGIDPLTDDMPIHDPVSDLTGLRVVLLDGGFAPGCGRDVLAARDRAAQALETAGARVESVHVKHLRHAGFLAAIHLAEETGVTFRETLHGEGASPLAPREMLAYRGNHTPAMRLLLLGEMFASALPRPVIRRLTAMTRELIDTVTEVVGDGVVLHPTMSTAAPRHSRTTGRPWKTNAVAPFCLAGLPVTQIPLGHSPHGIPNGVQAIGGPGNDHLTIGTAVVLEQAFGGWRQPESR